MPYANNGDVRIYYEIEGLGPPLVLAHGMGFGSDLTAWRTTGYTDALKNDFQLILFDFRGHGKSDKPRDNSSESDTADDIIAVLDDAGISKAHYLGYSMGAAAGFQQAVRHADRFFSFILGGMTPGPWPEEMLKASQISAELTKLRRTDPEAYFQQMERLLGHPLSQQEKEDLLKRDEGAGDEATAHQQWRRELTPQDLAGITNPCVLYCGSLDPFYKGAQESVQYMPRSAFISLDGLNHITAFSRSDAVVKFVKPLLLRLSQM